jgi:hypothetical protein
MAVRYKISPDLGIAFIFCEGVISDVEYFKLIKTLYNDVNYILGMRCIIDFFSAVEDISLEGMRTIIKDREEMEKHKIEFEYVIMLTHSHTIEILVKTIKLLTTNDKMKFEAVSSLDEAIVVLGFQDREQEIFDFYTRNKQRVEQTSEISS